MTAPDIEQPLCGDRVTVTVRGQGRTGTCVVPQHPESVPHEYWVNGVSSGSPHPGLEQAEAEQVDRDPPITSTSALTEAHELIYGPRAESYGPARPHFTQAAALWSAFLNEDVTAEQVAVCMALLKIARIAPHLETESVMRVPHDSIVDAAGYIGLVEKIQS